MSKQDIQYLSNTDIDYQKWDQCIAHSPNGNVYAYSWYLDRICDYWDALILGDYLYVMPLVHRKKFGISYIYQPIFSQQLGIFSVFPSEPEIVNQFLHAIPGKFKLVEMNLNTQNRPEAKSFQRKKRTTHHLELRLPVEEIRKNFHTNTLRNIRKAGKSQLYVSPLYSPDEFICFTNRNLQSKSPEIKEPHYESLKKIIRYAQSHHQGEMCGVYDERNQLVAAAVFVYANRQVIYLAASSTTDGTEKKAMFLLLDSFIERHAGQDLTLDFEGSDIPGVARFYQGFGAKPVSYFAVRRNTLPWYVKLFKK